MDQLIIENHSFTRPAIDSIPVQALNNQPVIYILYQNEQPKPTAYIGQSVQAVRRLQNHLSNPKRKGLHSILIYGHKTFNQSATC